MNIKTLIRTSLIALGLTLAPLGVAAQNLFSAAILVTPSDHKLRIKTTHYVFGSLAFSGHS